LEKQASERQKALKTVPVAIIYEFLPGNTEKKIAINTEG
jgi:hypothetical protein